MKNSAKRFKVDQKVVKNLLTKTTYKFFDIDDEIQ
jgi:hypothetical protein